MIDGEKSILPIVTFEATKDWADLHRVASPDLDRAGLYNLDIPEISWLPKRRHLAET
jgi:hypothetical protein